MRRFLVSFVIFSGLLFPNTSWAQATLSSKFVAAAIALKNPGIVYDGQYRRISYPMGDVPADVGVCSDVIIRAYRGVDIDLQKLVHEDMKKNFGAYPKLWGLRRPDRNIDHRRVPNLRVFFRRHGKVLNVSDDPTDYKPGDIVTWNLRQKGSLPHTGIVTNIYSPNNERPLIMHNIGGGQVLADMLFDFKITGHYRYALE